MRQSENNNPDGSQIVKTGLEDRISRTLKKKGLIFSPDATYKSGATDLVFIRKEETKRHQEFYLKGYLPKCVVIKKTDVSTSTASKLKYKLNFDERTVSWSYVPIQP